MPWRTIDAASTTSSAVAGGSPVADAASGSHPMISRATMAVVGATALIATAAFVLAFGGSSGSVALAGGAPLAGDAMSAGAPGGSALAGDIEARIVVEVVGAVARPGVYRLSSGSRVADLLDVAGGYGTRVDTDLASRTLNRAAVLKDGDQIRVPSRDDPSAPSDSGDSAAAGRDAGSGPLDLNRATSVELEALPGIGPVTAGKIIAARDETPFIAVDDLRTRKLLGQKTFDGLKDLVTVR